MPSTSFAGFSISELSHVTLLSFPRNISVPLFSKSSVIKKKDHSNNVACVIARPLVYLSILADYVTFKYDLASFKLLILYFSRHLGRKNYEVVNLNATNSKF